ncbi:MAG: hypothetical protein WCG14_06625 [Chlamydiia bacterium]
MLIDVFQQKFSTFYGMKANLKLFGAASAHKIQVKGGLFQGGYLDFMST